MFSIVNTCLESLPTFTLKEWTGGRYIIWQNKSLTSTTAGSEYMTMAILSTSTPELAKLAGLA